MNGTVHVKGMRAEFALDKATYHGLEITGGTLQFANGHLPWEIGLKRFVIPGIESNF